jgi:hypothetical protein
MTAHFLARIVVVALCAMLLGGCAADAPQAPSAGQKVRWVGFFDGVFRRDTRAAAIVTGTFLDKDAAGRWQGASCEGVWSLRRLAE